MSSRAPGGRRLQAEEHGSAAVLGVVFIGLLVALTTLVAAVGGMVVAQRRVESAADLGALAGAAAAQRGDNACAAARSVARLNGARMSGCAASGSVVQVRVVRTAPVVLGRRFTVESTARAGPVAAQRPG